MSKDITNEDISNLIDNYFTAIELLSQLLQVTELNMDDLEPETIEVLQHIAEFQNKVIMEHESFADDSDNDPCSSCGGCGCDKPIN